MDKTPEEEYREALKKQLTEKPPAKDFTYYSRTGFRKTDATEQKAFPNVSVRPRRRLGLALILPLMLILMMAGRLWHVIVPLVLGVVLYVLIKRRK